MGLGKTIQTIAYLGSVLRSPRQLRASAENKKPLLALIVCPTSVISNWEKELKRWGEAMGPLENRFRYEHDETFRVARIHGDCRKDQWARILAAVEIARDGKTARTATPANIALTSYDTFRTNVDEFADVSWTTCVFDEAHKLKNDKALIYRAARRLPPSSASPRIGLTGTIMQNTYDELWCLLDWACPGSLGEARDFREYYSSKMQRGQRHGASDFELGEARDRASQLKRLLRKYVLTRKKKDALREALPAKADNVVFCELAPLQLKAYGRLLAAPEFSLLARSEEPCDCASGEKRAACCYRLPNSEEAPLWKSYHENLAEHRVHEDGGCVSCPYCLCLPCMSILAKISNHLELLKPDPALLETDPEKHERERIVARMALGDDARFFGGADRPDENFSRISSSRHCGKLAALERLLRLWHARNDKVLIFSVSTRLLNVLEQFMHRRGYVFSRLDGSTNQKHRQTVVDDFNESQSAFVFLLSTKAGGVGLNITSANRVVVFDPNWNPALDLQAQDRSYRIGQRRDVDVYRFLTSGTLEELVYQRQVYKQQQSNMAVDGVEERRYFDGVQGDKEQKGELFGVANIFAEVARDVRMKKLLDRERIAAEEDFTNVKDELLFRIEKAKDAPARNAPRSRPLERRGEGNHLSAAGSRAPPPRDPSPATDARAHPGTADGVLYEHRHDRILGQTTPAERARSRRAVLAARARERENGREGADEAAVAGNARRSVFRKRPREDPSENASATAASRATVHGSEYEDADADDVVAALAAHKGVSVAEMGRTLLIGATGDRAAILREFLVSRGAADADAGSLSFR
jgi:SNF2 family DNA or RNA helicase